MEDFSKRKTGKDKSRRNFVYNGKYSAKHIRKQEALQQATTKRKELEKKGGSA